MPDSDNLGSRYLTRPRDPDLQRRLERLRALGIGDEPDREFDDVAAALATDLGTPYAMVNFLGANDQYFAGLYPASDAMAEVVAGSVLQAEAIGRSMPLDQGFCPHTVERRTALPLGNVCDYPRYMGNPVVDKLRIESYLGAPLIDEDGTVLGTVCVVDVQPHEWERSHVAFIKDAAADLVDRINRRDRQRRGRPTS